MSNWEQKAAICETINNYTGAASRLDMKTFASFFLEDAEVHGVTQLIGQEGALIGRDQVVGFFGPLIEGLDWLTQQNTTFEVTISADGKSATAGTNVIELAQPSGSDVIRLIARYDDELVLTDEGWRFKKRILSPFSFGNMT